MAEYIEREAALNRLCKENCGHDFVEDKCHNCYTASFLTYIPAADVALVVRGKWIQKDSRNPFSWRYCSECKHIVTAAQARVYQGCPVCLARMDGE